MILFNPWGLLGLLAIPAIIAIHLFRRRFHPRPVTGLFLYGPTVRTVAAGRKRQQLLWRTSLLMELLAALALTWYLSDPHLDERQQSRHVVVVLDSRWRVAANTAVGSVDAALRALTAQRIAALHPEDRVTLVTSGAAPVVTSGPAARPAEALAKLDAWRPQQPWHDLEGALTLGRSLADQGATVLLVSDRPPQTAIPGIALLTAGQALATVGVADARWYDDADGRRVVARILAQGAAATRRLELRLGERVVSAQDLRLVDGVPTTVVFPLPSDIVDTVSVALLGEDPLPTDDFIPLIPPPPSVVLARLADDPQAPLTKHLRRALGVVPGVRIVEDPLTAAHLHLGNAGTPRAGTWSLRFVAGEAKPVLGPFLTRRGHPVLGGIDFTGVLWTGGLPAPTAAWDASALMEAGGTILVSEERQGRDRILTLHADLATSGLTNHPAWPSLIANLVAARRATLPGVRQPNLLPGQEQLVTLPVGRNSLRVIDPDGRESRLNADGDGTVLVPGLLRHGLHRLLLDDETAVWGHLNILPCDARQADLRHAETTSRDATTDGRGLVERKRPMLAHLLPIIAAALVALAGWFTFTREEGRAP